jgi:transposase
LAGVADMRKGFNGLTILAEKVLSQDPFYFWASTCFRGRGDVIKVIWFGSERCVPIQQAARRGQFISAAIARDWQAQRDQPLAMRLLEGIDWRIPKRTWRP